MKVGTKVRSTTNKFAGVIFNKIGTIISINYNSGWPYTVFFEGFKEKQSRFPLEEDEFEVIQEEV